MKNAIIIHGMPEKKEYFNLKGDSESNCHWLPWLQKKLIVKGILAQTPEMPEPYEPVYEKWCKIFEEFEITPETILVGHSCGGGFLVRWLSENMINVGMVVLVAPWIDTEKELDTNMFNFVIDPEIISRTNGLTVMYSIDDDLVIIKSIDELKAILPSADFRKYLDKGHFTLGAMGTRDFPEIIEILGLQ